MYPINPDTCTEVKINLADCLQKTNLHPAYNLLYCTETTGEQIYFTACLRTQSHTTAAKLTLE